jgi:serine/threonine-protein kinase
MAREELPFGLHEGDVLRGKYRVERVLGEGGMGVVLLATHLRMDRRVAIKFLREGARAAEASRFATEARAASKLRGEHAVQILDVDDGDDGRPFIVMEHLEGADLHAVLKKSGPLAIAEAAAHVLQACEGIAEAHAAGIVHRDLKPANLFLTKRPDGGALLKILDFGISQSAGARGDVIGSPWYMAPEQLRGTATIDARADVWALGVVLYELLTNGLPFEASGAAELALRVASDPPRDARERRPELDEALVSVVNRCLEKNPADRYASVAELARALAPFAPSGDAAAARTDAVLAQAPASSPDHVQTAHSSPAPPTAPLTADLGATTNPPPRTEDLSILSRTGRDTPPPPPARTKWIAPAAAVGAVAIVIAIVAVVRPWSTARAPEAPPTIATTATATATATATETPPPPPSASASASARRTIVRPRMPSTVRSSAPTSTARNPMDIDFK